jgi:hypothetical protein
VVGKSHTGFFIKAVCRIDSLLLEDIDILLVSYRGGNLPMEAFSGKGVKS